MCTRPPTRSSDGGSDKCHATRRHDLPLVERTSLRAAATAAIARALLPGSHPENPDIRSSSKMHAKLLLALSNRRKNAIDNDQNL
ncbi:hypothetical protein [Accumulibacter sp.]|uniref:hypothetical protein n=1 Tax=Accumulibacter sp. TaxID=2053492 RepID=UPI0025F42828|nr:hypothetical protein [Accumulibacter sp.]MCP5230403.1 hypothetical protein [Accumulibacter sp.]